ncbi:hypothetical protein ARMGADRAFT_1089351 [Armillaria gallica]|uniref:Uncharacterized protein n=1 Tax=Armillaria gallica TaxID=47427 RepID=A0A2H3CYD4_ARMGA|nr:hypothetical protein ARMGADRAFT_1089351 [Armillaria gallica]
MLVRSLKGQVAQATFEVPEHLELTRESPSPQVTALIESMCDLNANASLFYELMFETCEHLVDNQTEQPASEGESSLYLESRNIPAH